MTIEAATSWCGEHSSVSVAPPAPLRVAHTIASLAAAHGGPSHTVPALCEALTGLGVAAKVVTADRSAPADDDVRPAVRGASSGRPLWNGAFRASLIEYLRRERVDLLHDNGIWLGTNHAAVGAARSLAIPAIISVRGMLEPWARRHRAWKKRLAWLLYQRRDLRHAAVLHATSDAEASTLRALGLRQPIAVIPNGVEVPERLAPRGSPRAQRTALFLGRIHPVKGLLTLVRAWATVRPPGWRVVVAGPDADGHRAEVEAAVRDAGLDSIFSFTGPADEARKRELFGDADLFVLPTFSENFGLAVAEALAWGVPVITTRGTPWSGVEAERCGWWVDIGDAALAAALREATALADDDRAEMGARGREWMRRQFAWSEVAREMRAVYEWVLRGGSPPGSVCRA